MKRLIILLMGLTGVAAFAGNPLTLEECVSAAEKNYPVVKQYNLLRQTNNLELSDIAKSWLPQAEVYIQGSVQNKVAQLPKALDNVMSQMGSTPEGLGKLQYRAGVELTQPIWDGGISKAKRKISRAELLEQEATLEVNLYSLRERVQQLFFAILLGESQLEQTEASIKLLEVNIGKMEAMLRNGVAMQADVDMMQAELLGISQRLISAKSNIQSCRRMLALLTGLEVEGREMARPTSEMPLDNDSNRPELKLFESKIKATQARRDMIKASLMPKAGFFAQVFYGYPGFDNFAAMMRRDLSFNALAGLKLSWNIGALYTKSNNMSRLRIGEESVKIERETFLYNQSIRLAQEREKIREAIEVSQQDAKIVELRGRVFKAAESQLENGVIDVATLLVKYNDELQARLTKEYHDIQLLQAIYQLKNSLNR